MKDFVLDFFVVANLICTPFLSLRGFENAKIIVIARRVSVAKRNEGNEAIYFGESRIKC